ncbi:MAG: family 1 encapsulin nanocompartment shell protein [Bacillota bacterium]
MEYLLRNDSLFTNDMWNSIDELVVRVAKEQLIGRRFIPIFGPLGPGVDSINIDRLDVNMDTKVDFFGEEDTPIKVSGRKYVTLPMLYKDFSLSWRDIERSKQMNVPVELAPAAIAATACCQKEDRIIFHGNPELGYPGLTTVEGRQVLEKTNWSEGENPFKDIALGIEMLIQKGFYGPYVLIVSPDLYLQMQRLQAGTGILELDRVKELVGGKIYQTPALGKNKAVLLNKGAENMDLVIGQDMVTAYLGPEQLNHNLRILETVLLRIKRPDAIVTFE